MDGRTALVTGASRGLRAAIADPGEPSAPAELFEEAVSALGSVDILVNNAGVIRRNPAAEYPGEDWPYILQVNLTAAFRLSQSAAAQICRVKVEAKF